MKICLSCGNCCLETEMQLSDEDIQKIEKNSSPKLLKEEFCFKTDEFFQLKNIEGHCIFYCTQTKQCKIYFFRPKGCEYYPLIYNLDTNSCEMDSDCPHKHLFYRHPPELQKKSKELRNWIQTQLNPKK